MIVVPLCGKGQRFKDHGYTQPKALIPVFGKPIIQFSPSELHTVRMICNTLLLTLCPLHNNEKCHEYMNLIKLP